MAGRYAQDTSVSADRSREEIAKTLRKYGATGFLYGEGLRPDGTNVAVLAFEAHGRRVQFDLPLPDPKSREFTLTPTGRDRSSNQREAAYEQAIRSRWRGLFLTIKALLEAVEIGLLTFEEAFLAKIMLPNGNNVADTILPGISEAYETGSMPQLLPETRRAIEA